MKKVVLVSWKRIVIIFCFVVALIVGIVFISGESFDNPIYVNQKLIDELFKTYYEPSKPIEGSSEELYQDIFVTLLLQHIDNAVENYYGTYYTVAPYMVNVLSVERPNGYRTFEFIIELEILPYTGPHNVVGIDHITIKVSSGPKIEVEKFEHIKSY